MVVFFAGLPGTIKFISEFYLFSIFSDLSPVVCILLMFFANALGLIGFSKCWFNAIFGTNRFYKKMSVIDLTIKELLILIFSFFFLFSFSYFPSFMF
jgi:NADH:ubiquinone oxidoreductase subunit 4 (subunit M)